MPFRRELNILELLGDVRGKKLLDAGCATGYFGEKLEKKGAKVTGVDSSIRSISKAKKLINNALILDLNNKRLPFEKNQRIIN